MKIKSQILLFIAALLSMPIWSNDGVYTTSGNHLIPITDMDVSIKKEILTIKKRNNEIYVTVDYTFFNHGKRKTVIVGFEAMRPFGDANEEISTKGHPFMRNFTVEMNGQKLNHKVDIVTQKTYADNGIINSLTQSEIRKLNDDSYYYDDYFYVYNFNADFKPGENKIKHTYVFRHSSSTAMLYSFNYVLTAANRWKNNVIEDFTLILDMGDMQEFNVANSAFAHENDWSIQGKGVLKTGIDNSYFSDPVKVLKCYIKHGEIVINKKNFYPTEELDVFSVNLFEYFEFNPSMSVHDNLMVYHCEAYSPQGELAIRILRNYPFAKKGYVFKNKELKDYYESIFWYQPDENYSGERHTLNDEELIWVDYFESLLK